MFEHKSAVDFSSKEKIFIHRTVPVLKIDMKSNIDSI